MRTGEWNGGHTSVLGRASAVLDTFGSDRTELGVSDIARASGLPKATVHRLAGELVELGLLERTGVKLRLGLRLFELGQLVPRQRTLREAALPYMEDLREAVNSNVHLAVREGVEVVYVEILKVRDSQSLPSRVGGRLPIHATGVGKAILAFGPPEVVQARIDAGLTRRTPYTIIMPGVLRQELATIRTTGVSLDREESALGVVCAAVPVFGTDGQVQAGLSVTGRVERLDLARMTPAVRTAGLALSRALRAEAALTR